MTQQQLERRREILLHIIEKKRQTAVQRFWNRVTNKEHPDECWPWWKVPKSKPYPHVAFSPVFRPHANVHRVAYFLAYGPIPKGRNNHICHKCNNKLCCNPKHLYLGTPSTNMKDAVKAGTWKSPSAKLTPALVKKIRTEYPVIPWAQKASYRKKLGITLDCIGQVIRRKTWAKV